MAYEKFIKKDGKLYGPYIYHSKRVDGKVISEYHGSRKVDYTKFFLVAFGVLLLGAFVYFMVFSEKSTTGNAVFDLNANYQKDKPLEGKLKLSLQEGELIPYSSKLILANNGKNFEFNLKDLISDETATGAFYVHGTSVSGSGEGYGIPGEKDVSPEVYFTLSILSQDISSGESSGADLTSIPIPEESSNGGSSSENESSIITGESGTQEAPVIENPQIQETPEALEETQATETQETPNEGAPVTGNAIIRIFGGASNFFLGLTPTGFAVVEFENEINGKVSSGESFTYTLQEGQRAELKPKSVRTDSKQLNDDEIEIKIQGKEVIVTTLYSEKEFGFGSDYLGSGEKEIVIDVSSLDLSLEEGDLKVGLVNQGQELISLTTFIQGEGEFSAEKKVSNESLDIPSLLPTQELETNNETFTPPLEALELTFEEKAILINEFGNFSVDAKEAIMKNGFIVIKYELGDYWVEYSYDSSLDNETLNSFMEKDKMKWLKDIAIVLSQRKEPEKILTGF